MFWSCCTHIVEYNPFISPILTLQGLDRFDQNGKILGYCILYRITADPTEVRPYEQMTFNLSDDHENSDQFNYTISDLTGGVSYDVVIEAYTSVGTGPRSESQTVVTLSGTVRVTVAIITFH